MNASTHIIIHTPRGQCYSEENVNLNPSLLWRDWPHDSSYGMLYTSWIWKIDISDCDGFGGIVRNYTTKIKRWENVAISKELTHFRANSIIIIPHVSLVDTYFPWYFRRYPYLALVIYIRERKIDQFAIISILLNLSIVFPDIPLRNHEIPPIID